MTTPNSRAASRIAQRSIALCVATGAVFATGCANLASTTGSTGAFATGAAVTGKVHGGNQPVGFATVQIYTVGQSGPGSTGTLLATTQTDAGGNFAFTKQASGSYSNTGSTYACPATGTNLPADRLLYIITRGGNTTGTGGSSINNSAAVFLAPLGFCNDVTSSQYVNISEVTTAAMVASVGQFINPTTEMIGNDGIGVAYAAINNSFRMVANLVSATTGLANTTVTIPAVAGASGVSGSTVTATPQSAKLNTVANILSACVNQTSASSASNCSTLFNNATPPPSAARTSQPGSTFSTATDTLQAALYMFLNPTDGSTANRTALYNLSPGTAAPYQPTVTNFPTDWTIAVSYASTSTCGTGSFLGRPYDAQIDLAGNVWIANAAGSLVELSPNGAPASCAALGGSGHGSIIDVAGNVWYIDSTGNTVSRYVPSSGQIRTYNATGQPLAISANDAGDIFFTTVSGGSGSVYLINSGANSTGINSPTLISNTVGSAPSAIFPDTANGEWVTSGSTMVTRVAKATGGSQFLNGYNSTPYNVTGPTYGVTVGPSNRVIVTAQDSSSTISVLVPSGAGYAAAPGFPTSANAGGLMTPTYPALDGGINIWTGNSVAEGSGNYALSLFAIDGTALTTSGSTGGYQKNTTYFNSLRHTTIDSGGNVWVTSDNLDSIVELVGSAVPVYQPYASGLQQNRFQQIP